MAESLAWILISIILAIVSVYFLSKKFIPEESDQIETRKFRVFARRTSWFAYTMWLMGGLNFMLSGNYRLEGNPWWMPMIAFGFVLASLIPAWYFSAIPSLEQKNEPEWAGIITGLVWVIWWFFTGTLLILLASLPFLLSAN